MDRAARTLTFVAGVVTLGPAMVAGGAFAAFAMLAEWFGPEKPGSWLDFLYGAPLVAKSGSFMHYVMFMIGGLIAVGCYQGLVILWEARLVPGSPIGNISATRNRRSIGRWY